MPMWCEHLVNLTLYGGDRPKTDIGLHSHQTRNLLYIESTGACTVWAISVTKQPPLASSGQRGQGPGQGQVLDNHSGVKARSGHVMDM
jgi:hypothetical protein